MRIHIPVNKGINRSIRFLFFFIFSMFIRLAVASDEPVVAGHSNDDLKRGERFFKGLLPFNRSGESCVSCHNLTQSDTLNWNPSAMDVALKYVSKDLTSFQSAVLQPSGVKM